MTTNQKYDNQRIKNLIIDYAVLYGRSFILKVFAEFGIERLPDLCPSRYDQLAYNIKLLSKYYPLVKRHPITESANENVKVLTGSDLFYEGQKAYA